MKVLFTFGGLPHYLVALLNKINAMPEFEVVVVIPGQSNGTIGKGVKLIDSGYEFKLIKTSEYKTWYGKPQLTDLDQIIITEKPEIVVSLWPYIIGFAFLPKLRRAIQQVNTKLVIREIPFMVAPKHGAVKYYQEHPIYDENLHFQPNSGWRFKLKTHLLTIMRQAYYKQCSATINYTDVAYNVQPSFGIAHEDIHVTLNSPNTDEIKKAYLTLKADPQNTPKPFRIIHVGRLVKWKKVHHLLQAVDIIRKQIPEVELVVIGNGPELDNLKTQAAALNLEDHVKFLGAVYGYEQLGKEFMQAAVFVLAGMGGLAINEGMAFGKPIVCSVGDGTERHLLRHGENGYFFKENDINDLAEKITELLQNPEKVAEFGQKSLDIIDHEVNINTVADRFRTALQKIAAK
ncbi:glycosyltransferase [Persicobacter psychrovividus]|uniref:Glycosyl transferase n=1 Tax=Persicobacter psychrovividus TaxID=387638 RepID=A0ABM7VA89_9BACT|nr:glycosyl transferase [Persicobacter psychrovividus]